MLCPLGILLQPLASRIRLWCQHGSISQLKMSIPEGPLQKTQVTPAFCTFSSPLLLQCLSIRPVCGSSSSSIWDSVAFLCFLFKTTYILNIISLMTLTPPAKSSTLLAKFASVSFNSCISSPICVFLYPPKTSPLWYQNDRALLKRNWKQQI